MTPAPRIPLHTTNDMFAKLQWEHDRLQNEWSEYNSFNFVVTAYHLYEDWISAAGSYEERQRRKQLPAIARKLAHVLRDITNASKHWHLDPKGEAKRIVDDVLQPTIADWGAYFNTGPLLYIEVDGARLSMFDLSRLTVDTLQWIVHGADSGFPADVEAKLQKAFEPLQ